MKRKYFAILFLFLFSGPTFAQRISKELCERIFGSADKILAPAHVYRRETYTSDCKYEFDGKDGGSLYVSVEIFKNRSSAKKEVWWQQHNTSEGDRVVKSKNQFWDSESFVHPKQQSDSATLALRRGLYVVVLMSHDEDRMKELEKLIRTETFTNWTSLSGTR